MTQEPPRLFQAKTSSASWRVRIALGLKEIAYKSSWIDLSHHDHLSKTYSAINPSKQVPCLQVQGNTLCQSVAIIEYLDEVYPDPPLMPGNSVQRAKVREIVEIINSVAQPLHNYAVRERLKVQFHATEESASEWCRYWIEYRLANLEEIIAVGHGSYCVGDSITIADVFLYPQIQTANRFGAQLDDLSAIKTVMTRLQSVKEFAESHV